MDKDDRLDRVSAEEREDWLRWRQRGRFRYFLYLWGLYSIASVPGLLTLTLFVDVSPELPLGIRVPLLLGVALFGSAVMAFFLGEPSGELQSTPLLQQITILQRIRQTIRMRNAKTLDVNEWISL
ncbi:MAG: hypothetical protein R3C10_20745 [Pirellulales bacterium]